MNQNPSSRPFLRLFSSLQAIAGQPDTTAELTDPHHDTQRQSKPLQSDDKMIAGSIGPRSIDSRSADPRSTHCGTTAPRRVEVSLADIAPVLADAINHQRGWLSDFSDDTVSIDADLYEVLLAYQQMRRLNAA